MYKEKKMREYPTHVFTIPIAQNFANDTGIFFLIKHIDINKKNLLIGIIIHI